MAKTSKIEKSAEKAYDKAKDAVDDARKLAKKVAKKRRPPVDELTKDLKKAKADLKRGPVSQVAGKSGEASAGDLYTPPLPHQGGVDDLHSHTLISLRTMAKSRGLTGISRLSKTALIERLEQG